MEHSFPALVSRMQSGDLDALAAVMAEFRPQFGRYAWQMLGSREEAEEALQDTFVRAYRSIGSCRDPRRFGAWLFQILVNRCRTSRKRLILRERRRVPAGEVELGSVPHPEAHHAWREEIDRALGLLPESQREAFLLKHVEGMTYDEMADITGAAVPALKMRVLRACEALRTTLAEAMYD